ncbi:MAG: DUF3048 domain-containing protein, partial [Chloroflexi bacterium]|nr:DUF3048 domain-containing protein [Chloroflexota bacterium]
MAMHRRLLLVLIVSLAVGCSPIPSTSPSLTGSLAPTTVESQAPAPTGVAPSPSPRSSVWADVDGQPSSQAYAHRLPLVVSIDDSRVARPQSGFNAASIVWQAPADGYESRYLLVFQEKDAKEIGPVRSGRMYLASWAAELGGVFAHYGGDALTRAWIGTNAAGLFTNVDGLGAGNPAFHRVGTREAPHNAYTSTAELWRVAARLGAAATFDPSLGVRPFRDDSPIGNRGASQQILVPYNTVRVGYAYDPTTNAYLRSLDAKPQIDPGDGMRVRASTVVV